MSSERREFQAEVKQLLDLMVHSIYSNKDVFLRELISNASDALDKLRFEQLTSDTVRGVGEPEIWIERNEAARTLTISDNGIGMTEAEVIENLGTIARSGTKEFLETLKKAGEAKELPDLIGQFGVGFYSAFMVAHQITVLTRKAGEEKAVHWVSDGAGGYEIASAERDRPGTTVTLLLKDADEEAALPDYLDEHVIRGIVKRYSDFVGYPIKMQVWREHAPENEDEPSGASRVLEDVTLNSMKAIWTRPKDEISDEEYTEFYHHISHDWQDPLEHLRVKIEGTFEANALLFIPSKAPFDLYHREMKRGIQLFVKRVFIMDECKELMPDHLRFVRGVVDAEDLSLNVSRETLQKDRQITAIRKQLTKRVYRVLQELLLEKREAYTEFWTQFGPAIKEGLLSFETTGKEHDEIMKLMLVPTTHGLELSTLAEYVERMNEDQDAIYYMTGPSRAAMERSPHLEAFKSKGYEVILLSHHVDEIWPERIREFDGKTLKSVGKGQIELGSEEEKKAAEEKQKEQEKAFKDLLTCLRVHLQDEVKEVRLSSRLTDSVACLVSEEGEMTPQMAKLLESMGQDAPKVKRTLEINPEHALVTKLEKIFTADNKDPRLEQYAKLIHGQSVLAEGAQLDDPAAYAKLVSELMLASLED